jgi:NAD(P)-dependent dehydrogenase (short-subunit alcohol dehydrogenase family)
VQRTGSIVILLLEGGLSVARLEGRVAIVTGGAKGICVHYVRALAAEGARLMIADIADGRELAESLARAHGANSLVPRRCGLLAHRVISLVQGNSVAFGD